MRLKGKISMYLSRCRSPRIEIPFFTLTELLVLAIVGF